MIRTAFPGKKLPNVPLSEYDSEKCVYAKAA
jgi:hypothetical protein